MAIYIKKYYIFFIFLLLVFGNGKGHAQTRGKVGTNPMTINASAAFEVESTTQGVLLPRMTRVNRNAIGTPATGLMINCTDCGKAGEIQYFDGTNWRLLTTTMTSQSYLTGGNAICDGTTQTTVVEITSPTTGRIWMDRNLGASQPATGFTDYLGFGCLYQWGRGNDGHASMTWTNYNVGSLINGSIEAVTPYDAPASTTFFTVAATPFDWRSPQNDLLWDLNSQINNPCPLGFRVPFISEFDAETTILDWNGSQYVFNTFFRLPRAGYINRANGSLISNTNSGYYWTSDHYNGSTNSVIFYFNGSYRGPSQQNRAIGCSVRCIKY